MSHHILQSVHDPTVYASVGWSQALQSYTADVVRTTSGSNKRLAALGGTHGEYEQPQELLEELGKWVFVPAEAEIVLTRDRDTERMGKVPPQPRYNADAYSDKDVDDSSREEDLSVEFVDNGPLEPENTHAELRSVYGEPAALDGTAETTGWIQLSPQPVERTHHTPGVSDVVDLGTHYGNPTTIQEAENEGDPLRRTFNEVIDAQLNEPPPELDQAYHQGLGY